MAAKDKYKSLISLLDDPDSEVTAAVEAHIVQEGAAIVPYLEAAALHCRKDSKQRIADIVERLRTTAAEHELSVWLANDGNDILRGMFCLARFVFHDINYAKVCRSFNEIVGTIEKKIAESQSTLRKVETITNILFKVYGFRNNYLLNYDTAGHLVHLMLAKRRVNPMSLVLLYLCIAERLNISMKIVSLPENFVLLCENSFYINPAMDGEIFGTQSMKPYATLPMKTNDDMPIYADSIVMLYHLARALREAYECDNKTDLALRVTPAIKLLSNKLEIAET